MLHASNSSFSLRGRTLASTLAILSLIGGSMLVGCGGGGGSTPPNNNPGAGTGGVSATFSNASGTNANTSAFQSSQVLAQTSSGAFTLLNITGTNISGSTSRTFLISLADNGPIQAGKTYTFASPSPSTLSYTESAGATAHGWVATGGSAIVDSITGKNYKVRLVNATLTSGEDNGSGATGSFTVNGTANVTLP